VNEVVGTEEESITQSESSPRPALTLSRVIAGYRAEALVMAIALLVWMPRLTGPIDLRWDGGVYYVLGTSLSTGHGYRILSEPGSPEALQYPPLLAAIVALHQLVLGSTDPAVVGFYLRISYALLFALYALAVLALAKRYLKPIWALAAAALCLLHFQTIFLSDLLFAEMPFALVSVIFALVAAGGPVRRPFLRETGSFALGAVGFLLRTAGATLLAAWVLEALARRRWPLAIARGAVAIVPIVGWQAYVGHVRTSDEYARPTYEYQRASYQYYNVSYAENMLLVDPFRPELGRLNSKAYVTRLATNLPSVLGSLGEAISTRESEWQRVVENPQRHLLRKVVIPGAAAVVPIFALAALVLGGLILLLRRGAWLTAFIILGSVVLIWATPWPEQFIRYLMPLAPFLSICAFMVLSAIADVLRNRGGWAGTMARVAFAGVIALIFAVELYTSLRLFRLRALDASVVLPATQGNYRLFAHDKTWQDWEAATAWIASHARSEAIIATSSPHFLYLRTGHLAVLPPMEADPVRALHQLEAVPVSYVIVDEVGFVDISRRYARPAVERNPFGWRNVYSVDATSVYEHNPVTP
jgi:hypothetical protein